MKLDVRCTRKDDRTYEFVFSSTGVSYRGTVDIALEDDTPSKLTVKYTEPRNDTITDKMRESFDPYVIDAILRKLTTS